MQKVLSMKLNAETVDNLLEVQLVISILEAIQKALSIYLKQHYCYFLH